MKKQITLIIKDDGIDKTFLINKAKGMAAFDLFMDINQVIEKADGAYAGIAQQFMHNCMQTGMEVAGIANSQVEKIIRENADSLIFFIFNAFFKELDTQTRNHILEQIFQHIIFKNGAIDTSLTVVKNNNNAEHIDLYINDIQTVFTLCREFVRLNYGHFLPQTAEPSSTADLAQG